MYVADQVRQCRSELGLPVTAAASVQRRHHPGPQYIHRDYLPTGLTVVNGHQRKPHRIHRTIGAAVGWRGYRQRCQLRGRNPERVGDGYDV